MNRFVQQSRSTFVIAVHDEILLQTGVGRSGCHIEKLESVLNRIDQQMYYSDVSDIFEIAAWFGIAISKGHAFVDGNKRTGFMMAAGFLERNGWRFTATETDAAIRTLALAAGEMTKSAYAAWLETNSSAPSE